MGRRLGAVFAGDYLAAGVLSSVLPALEPDTVPAPDELVTSADLEGVIADARGLGNVGAAAVLNDRTAVFDVINKVLGEGADALRKVGTKCFYGQIFSGLLNGLSDISSSLVRQLPRGIYGWLTKKVRELFGLARDKVVSLIGQHRIDAVAGWIKEKVRHQAEDAVDDDMDRIIGGLYPWLFNASGFESFCRERLDQLDVTGIYVDYTRLALIPTDADGWFRWAGWGAKGVGVAGYFLHGPVRVLLLIAGALLAIYILFVTQDHLDWPDVGLFPDLADGVGAVLA